MKKIVVTPAGRKRYLEVLFLHMEREHTNNGFDEWHLWLNTNIQSDITYCQNLEKSHSWIKTIQIEGIIEVSNLNICKFFKFACDEDAVYIRLDDDIVFIEKGFFDKLYRYRIENPEPFLVYGNIINNAIISYLHQNNGLVNYPEKLTYNCGDRVGWEMPFFAEAIHRAFIADVKAGNIDKWHNSFKEHVCKDFERVSINCIAWLGKTFAEFGGDVNKCEEPWLSSVKSCELNKPNVIFGDAIVAHFAFFTQRNHLDRTNILDEYKKLINYT